MPPSHHAWAREYEPCYGTWVKSLFSQRLLSQFRRIVPTRNWWRTATSKCPHHVPLWARSGKNNSRSSPVFVDVFGFRTRNSGKRSLLNDFTIEFSTKHSAFSVCLSSRRMEFHRTAGVIPVFFPNHVREAKEEP